MKIKSLVFAGALMVGILAGALVTSLKAQSTVKWQYTYVDGAGARLAEKLTQSYGEWEFVGLYPAGCLLKKPA